MDFTPPRRTLASTRRFWEALVGLVFLRGGGGGLAASRISSSRRSSASARLRSWVRKLIAVRTSTPSWVSLRPASRISRTATSLGSEGERRTSKRSSTAVETLLTFWPPGPAARMNRSVISSSEMEMAGVTSITGFPDIYVVG